MRERIILQIDDNEDVLMVGKRVLNEAGFIYMSARSAGDGLIKALKRKPDLILLDYYLNDKTGVELLVHVAEDPAYQAIRNTPTVILSGKSDLGTELRDYYSFGLRAVLKKPFNTRLDLRN